MDIFRTLGIVFLLGTFCLCSCSRGPLFPSASLCERDREIAAKLGMEEQILARLKAKPLYRFEEKEVDSYLRYLSMSEPDLPARVVHLAEKNIGQPYQIFLLGEYPFEIYDKDPLYRLDKSDCLTFVEHMYAMALGYDWPSFFAFLQRIRYMDGEIGMTTRNHDTLPDWVPENSRWLIYDLTEDLAPEKAQSMTVETQRRKFYKKWNIGQDVKEETVKTDYLPTNIIPGIVDQLEDGDFVNVIRGFGKPQWCGHVGLISKGEDGTVFFVHSRSGGVTREPILEYMEKELEKNTKRKREKKWQFFGFKFHRLRGDPIAKLRALDGPAAPKVTAPRGLLLSRLRYPGWVEPRAELSREDINAAEKLELDQDYLAVLKARPLYEFDEREIGDYLAYLSEVQPDLAKRVVHLARKNIGQPYHIFLLGEAPFELYDNDPLYCLHKSDCVVFSEHMYAMALSRSWEQFMIFLQRIRFKDGEIGVLTRNHFTVAEWDTSNSWLLEDMSRKLAGDDAAPMVARTRHNSLFKSRYGIEVDMPDAAIDTFFVPTEKVPEVAGQLRNGDFLNVIYGSGENCYAGHVGLITVDEDGTVNFLHSTPPRVREQPLLEYNATMAKRNPEREKSGRAPFRGFKFFRLREDPMSELQKRDGPDAPVVKAPIGVIHGPGRRWVVKPEEEKP